MQKTKKKGAVKLRPDAVLKEFWRDNDRFADLFNTVLFQGKNIIRPEILTDEDTDLSSVMKRKEDFETVIKVRDVVKKSAHGISFMVMGIENQMKIHYAMPVRTMLYDALGYTSECKKIAAEMAKTMKDGQNPAIDSKQKAKLNSGEFLSGFRKTDKLHPVVTIVIYYAEEPWDGPLSLHDMLDIPGEIKPVINDYRLNLLQIRESGKYHFQNADVGTVFEIVREIYEKRYEKLKRDFADLPLKEEIGLVVGTITESDTFIKSALHREKEDFNMCKALEELEEKCREEGIERGIKRGIEVMILDNLEEGVAPSRIQEKLVKRFDLSPGQAKEYYDKFACLK